MNGVGVGAFSLERMVQVWRFQSGDEVANLGIGWVGTVLIDFFP